MPAAGPEAEEHRAPAPFVPCIRLFAAPVMVTRTEGLSCRCEEVLAPLVELTFDYGGTHVRSRDERRRIFRAVGDGLVPLERDTAGEAQARRVLERLGAVDLECVEGLEPPPDCDADYIVRVDGDAHAFCAFTANALPQLRALGWRVNVDPDYPFRVVEQGVSWYASVEPHDELPDWFALELGVEVDGRRVDLLPLVVQLVEEANESDGLYDLERAVRPSYALRVNDTQHVNVSPERLRALVRVVIELYRGGNLEGGKLAFPGVQAPALARLDEVFGASEAGEQTGIRWHDPTRVVARARTFVSKPKHVEPPAGLQATLRPYQQEGVAFLQHLREHGVGGILADDMGLGKTLQTIAHICLEKASGRMRAPVLIVTPTSLVGNWLRELGRFAPHLRALALQGPGRFAKFQEMGRHDVVITTYPLLVRDEERFAGESFHMVVLDEAQAIKNNRSQAHRAIKSIFAEHRLCITGTPVENHLGELWALFDFLNPGLLGDELTFRRWYRQPIEQLGDGDRLTALRDLIAPYVIRRIKRDVARELPPKTELLIPVELRGRQRELYEDIRVAAHADVRKAIRTKGLAASTIRILDALMKLRQVCCDPRLVAMDAARSVVGSAKYEALFELLDGQLAQGHRVLVFSQFTSMLALISEGLRERGVEHLVLTGATRDRQASVDAFERGRADVFLISLKAGGTGLNLVSADTVIHYDPWWNPAAQNQATDRAYRIGQSRPVFVYNLFVAGSVEERVMRLQQQKRWLSNTLLGDEAHGPSLREQDVETLFAPLEPEGEAQG